LQKTAKNSKKVHSAGKKLTQACRDINRNIYQSRKTHFFKIKGPIISLEQVKLWALQMLIDADEY